MDEPAIGIKECGGMDLDVDRPPFAGEKDGFDGAAALGHELFQVRQDLTLLPLRNDIPQAHPQHLFARIAQPFELGLVDVHELPRSVDLVDHLRRILDQIPILLLEESNVRHPLL